MKGATALLCASTSKTPNHNITIRIGSSQYFLRVLRKAQNSFRNDTIRRLLLITFLLQPKPCSDIPPLPQVTLSAGFVLRYTGFHLMPISVDRRSFLQAALGGAAAVPALAQRDWSGRNPVRYPDPDVVILDPRFAKLKVNNSSIERLYTGLRWAEGPAWNGAGRYLIWSDIPNDRHMRWIEEDGHISVYRSPSHYANGNTFDWEGRLLSCEQDTRRVVRYEHTGAVTVLADNWNGKPFNSPNDIVVHPDGAIWFTDPGYGITGNYEGHKA